MPYAPGVENTYLNPNLPGQPTDDASSSRLPTMDPSRYAVGLVLASLGLLWLMGWRLNGI